MTQTTKRFREKKFTCNPPNDEDRIITSKSKPDLLQLQVFDTKNTNEWKPNWMNNQVSTLTRKKQWNLDEWTLETKTKDWKLLVLGNNDEIGEDNVCFDNTTKIWRRRKRSRRRRKVMCGTKKVRRRKAGPADFFFFFLGVGFFVNLIFVFSVFFFSFWKTLSVIINPSFTQKTLFF